MTDPVRGPHPPTSIQFGGRVAIFRQFPAPRGRRGFRPGRVEAQFQEIRPRFDWSNAILPENRSHHSACPARRCRRHQIEAPSTRH